MDGRTDTTIIKVQLNAKNGKRTIFLKLGFVIHLYVYAKWKKNSNNGKRNKLQKEIYKMTQSYVLKMLKNDLYQ